MKPKRKVNPVAVRVERNSVRGMGKAWVPGKPRIDPVWLEMSPADKTSLAGNRDGWEAELSRLERIATERLKVAIQRGL